MHLINNLLHVQQTEPAEKKIQTEQLSLILHLYLEEKRQKWEGGGRGGVRGERMKGSTEVLTEKKWVKDKSIP